MFPPVRWVDVILRRPTPPDDERSRRGREIEALQVKSDSTLSRVDNLLLRLLGRRR